ncbi:MAG: hypothetical protein K1X46_09585 [Chitinophagaceae bacterium]|nr:hypothetical protein [Chitinophagaceae bacterium]
MFKYFLFILLLGFYTRTKAQKIEAIYFNLYTDSLKKEVHYYINIEGKLANGKFIPLDSSHIKLSCNTGNWYGNNLVIDSSYLKDSVVITAQLKQNLHLQKQITVFIKKINEVANLKTEEEVLQSLQPTNNKNKKRKNKR